MLPSGGGNQRPRGATDKVAGHIAGGEPVTRIRMQTIDDRLIGDMYPLNGEVQYQNANNQRQYRGVPKPDSQPESNSSSKPNVVVR